MEKCAPGEASELTLELLEVLLDRILGALGEAIWRGRLYVFCVFRSSDLH